MTQLWRRLHVDAPADGILEALGRLFRSRNAGRFNGAGWRRAGLNHALGIPAVPSRRRATRIPTHPNRAVRTDTASAIAVPQLSQLR